VISNREICYLDTTKYSNSSSQSNPNNENSMMLHFNHHIGMDVATLEQFRNILSMYVHPVIRNDELDIYNTFGLNHNNSNNYSNSNHINAYNSNLRNQQKQIARRRHGAEAEIRSVYTIFIHPHIDTSALMNPSSSLSSNLKPSHSSDVSQLVNHLNQVMVLVTRILKKYKGHLRQYIVDDKGVVLIATFGLRGSACQNMLTKHALPATHDIYTSLIDELDVKSKIGATFGRAYCGVVGGWKRHEFAVLG